LFKRFLYIILILLIIGCGVGLRFIGNYPIESVFIEGELSLPERSLLQEKIRKDFKAGIFDVDLFDKINNIGKHFNWVYSIEVRRDWPNSLVLKVEKILPVAKWNNGKYLSSQAKVIDSVLDYDDLPGFNVTSSSPIKSMQVYRDLAGKLQHNNLNIVELTEDAYGEWSVIMSNGLVVRLGSDGLSRSLRRSILAYSGLAPKVRSNVEYIDARYSGGVVLKVLSDSEMPNYFGFVVND
jgi:cell division protein FtsQ